MQVDIRRKLAQSKCYERDIMLSLSDYNQADVVQTLNSTSRYRDDLLNVVNLYFEHLVSRIYPTELLLNKANSFDNKAPFLDLDLSITNDVVLSKMYDKCYYFDFEIVNFPFLDGYIPRSPFYGVFISKLLPFARVSSNVGYSNIRN